MKTQHLHATIAILLASLLLGSCSKPTERDYAHLIQTSIQYSYPGIYSDLRSLRSDYPEFNPRVRRWSDDLVFLLGEGLYAVQMPEEEVIVTKGGEVKTTRRCGGTEADCSLVAPQNPELAVVGTVQLDGPDHPIAQDLEVNWEGSPGFVYVAGHCFAAFKNSQEPLKLSLRVPGYKPIEISDRFGSHVVAATFSSKFNYYAIGRVPKTTFSSSRTCSTSARSAWPNVGGGTWKR